MAPALAVLATAAEALLGVALLLGAFRAGVRIRVKCTQIDHGSKKWPRRGSDEVKKARIPL
jgi:hypothetical protein